MKDDEVIAKVDDSIYDVIVFDEKFLQIFRCLQESRNIAKRN